MRLPRSLPRCWRNQIILLVVVLACAVCACASAYNSRPKLVVIIVIDQFRGDYLERYHDQFGDGGFKLFLDRGAYFTDCNYDYANTRTAPGHATLLTGACSAAPLIRGVEQPYARDIERCRDRPDLRKIRRV